MKQGPTGRSSPVSLNAVSVVPCQATRRAGRATPGFALQKRNLHTTVSAGFRRLVDVSFDRALSSNPVDFVQVLLKSRLRLESVCGTGVRG